MDREQFVGVVLSFAVEGAEPVEHVLTEFVGEGNTAIVFAVAPRSDPADGKWVLKLFKPDVRFEMTVLHHSLRIAEELFPQHPLLMPPEERMRRLADEMLGRIASDGVVMRVDVFRLMLTRTIEVLAHHFYERFRSGTLAKGFLDELGAVKAMIDDNLAVEIESMLDRDAIVEDARPFVEHCLEAIRERIAREKREKVYHPLSANPLFKLLGLHLLDFISGDELSEITNTEKFRFALTVDRVSDLSEAVSILYFLASWARKQPKRDDAYKQAETAAIAAARYLDALAAKLEPARLDLSGFAKNWHARTLLLSEKRAEALAVFEDALAILTNTESLRERHDTLADLARLLAESDADRARSYAHEARRIRAALKEA
jgi:hypothetical protein